MTHYRQADNSPSALSNAAVVVAAKGQQFSPCACKLKLVGPTVQMLSHQMAWIFILFADVFEIAWPFVLKRSAAFSNWSPLLAVLLFTPSAFLLSHAVRKLPAATVYASFTGIATAGTAIIGMVFFGESPNLGRVCSLMLVVIGLIGLKMFSGAGD